MNYAERKTAIVDRLRPDAQPLDASEHAIELILEGLQILGENRDLVALLQVAGQANAQAQRLISEQAITARKSA